MERRSAKNEELVEVFGFIQFMRGGSKNSKIWPMGNNDSKYHLFGRVEISKQINISIEAALLRLAFRSVCLFIHSIIIAIIIKIITAAMATAAAC